MASEYILNPSPPLSDSKCFILISRLLHRAASSSDLMCSVKITFYYLPLCFQLLWDQSLLASGLHNLYHANLYHEPPVLSKLHVSHTQILIWMSTWILAAWTLWSYFCSRTSDLESLPSTILFFHILWSVQHPASLPALPINDAHTPCKTAVVQGSCHHSFFAGRLTQHNSLCR